MAKITHICILPHLCLIFNSKPEINIRRKHNTADNELGDTKRAFFGEESCGHGNAEGAFIRGRTVEERREMQEKALQTRGGVVDKSGKGGIIKISSKFVNPKEKLYRYADSIKPIKGFDDIICHGSPNELIINGLDGEEWTYSAKQSADMIRNSTEFSGKNIRLISCQTGADKDCIAQQIADELGVEVMAPTEIINVNSNGEMFLSDNDALAQMWNAGEQVVQTGTWIVFKPKGGV